MSSRRVSIIFCGGCNPRIDRGQIAQEVRTALLAQGVEVIFNSLDAGFVIYMSGCTANCAQRYHPGGKECAVVAAETLDMTILSEEQLAGRLLEKVRDYFERLENPL
ncbi:MAG: hypothetical protein P4N59_26275 [Negativicutes bacterium]|nr:hypothetical protein [Negativicutes bacterium]